MKVEKCQKKMTQNELLFSKCCQQNEFGAGHISEFLTKYILNSIE